MNDDELRDWHGRWSKGNAGDATSAIVESLAGKRGDEATAAVNAGKALDTQKVHSDADGEYSEGRKALHEAIIAHFMKGAESHPRPTAIFTGGGSAALALDTPLPTPSGWTTMGDVEVGDELLDEFGQATAVVRISPVMVGHDVFDVQFDDGSIIAADGGHLWYGDVNGDRYDVLTTYELKDLLPKPFTIPDYQDPGRETLRWIVRSILPVQTEPVKCVTVANTSHLFLAGKSRITTRNSGKSALAGRARESAANLPVPKGHVYVNNDDIKAMLPEYKGARDAGHPEVAATITHEEASHVAKALTAAAMKQKKHLVIDGTGNAAVGKFGGKLKAAKAAGYVVKARYAHISTEEAKTRETARAERRGRKVDHSVLEAQHKMVSKSFNDDVRHIKGIHVAVYSTAGRGKPSLIAEKTPLDPVVKPINRKLYDEFVAKGA